ncbi:MAG: type II toxin-antitoxin system HicA family toxin [Planctomycetota bacterium]
MPRLPCLSGRDMIRRLEGHGFAVIRVRGSHHVLRHPDGRTTVVPVHGNETLGPSLLRKILRDCELTPDDISR